ncbi:DUF6461 domain-containing protein [Actinoplanes sp. TRM 88003]|uniref:DUF6461 domain-containing protein n=2 Tax=Paractinoplanes aksuensis TaxID=2939490 RepID=A0ABT1E3A6_9ACTN|nr:DUF6461 domain-containing protein [Actinoplanes aksuensis]
MVGGLLAGCSRAGEKPGGSASGGVSASPSGSGAVSASLESSSSLVAGGRLAVAGDYQWFRGVRDLDKGFCFVWVSKAWPALVIERMGAKELERILWQQMVGAGDGERVSGGPLYFGVTRLDADWSLVVEDNGRLGEADELLKALSVGSTVVCLYRALDGRQRFLVLEDEITQLEFDPRAKVAPTGVRAGELAPVIKAVGGSGVEAGFALAERLTGVPVELSVLEESTYRFSRGPTGQ